MSLASGSSLWNIIQAEQDWQNMGVSVDILSQRQEGTDADAVDEILNLISKDQFELEKILLKRDWEILNSAISFNESGRMRILFDPKKLMAQNKQESSDDSENSDDLTFDQQDSSEKPQK